MNTKVSVKEKICYGIGSGGGNIITQILGTFLTAYYTDSVGIAAAAVGTMMLVARLLDGISDVMMGGIVDKTRTKWGKARPWILISAPVICIGLILTFNVPGSLSSSAKLIYAYITYVFLNCIAFTAYMISHTALGQKVGLGLGAAIASWIIAAGGYVGTAKVQTASANSAIIFAYIWFGVILAALLLVVSLLLNIDKYEGQIKKDLEQRHKA